MLCSNGQPQEDSVKHEWCLQTEALKRIGKEFAKRDGSIWSSNQFVYLGTNVLLDESTAIACSLKTSLLL